SFEIKHLNLIFTSYYKGIASSSSKRLLMTLKSIGSEGLPLVSPFSCSSSSSSSTLIDLFASASRNSSSRIDTESSRVERAFELKISCNKNQYQSQSIAKFFTRTLITLNLFIRRLRGA